MTRSFQTIDTEIVKKSETRYFLAMKNLLAVSALILISACATPHPDRIPEINAATLPALQIDALKPPTTELKVENKRQINQTAGNSTEVAEVVLQALTQSLSRGGIEVKASSKNRLNAVIEDCKKSDQKSECVSITLVFKTPRYQAEVTGYSQNGMQRGNYVIPGGGDLSEAYEGALKLVIDSLPDQIKKGMNH